MTERMPTTTFYDDSAVVDASYKSRVEKDDVSVRFQSIPDFLAKPWLVQNVSWTTASAQGVPLMNASIGNLLTGNAYWDDKMEGFAMVRGTAVIRVQINANPFQQGKLLVHFLPCVSQFSSLDPSYVAMHNANISTRRQQPCLEIDCRDSVGIFKIPYIAPSNWFLLKDSSYDWGTFYVAVLSPLETGSAGETTVDVTIYISFEDFELAAPIVPQSGAPKNKFRARAISRKDISTEELEAFGERPIANALRSVSTASSALGSIPMLAPIARPVAWASDVASQVASSLGWSKPQNNVPSHIVSGQFNRFGACSDGPDNSYPLALRSDNKIKVSDALSVYEADEMSWSFLKKVCTIQQTVDWTTSQAGGTTLVSQKFIGPKFLGVSGSSSHGGHTVNWKTGAPIFYFSNMFDLWRGSIKLMVKIAKTDFHTGRLQLTFTPTRGIGTSPNVTTAQLALREIIDLRVGNEFAFDLPYLMNLDYISTDEYSGILDIQVINELRGPETVSSAVQILMYFCGGDDLEFQAPGFGGSGSSLTSQPFYPQVGGDDEVISEGIGNEPTKSMGTVYSELSNGEMFNSVKQFLDRYNVVQYSTWAGNGERFLIYPWANNVATMNPSSGVLTSTGNFGDDIMSRIAPCYAFYRGGVRLQIADPRRTLDGSPYTDVHKWTLQIIDYYKSNTLTQEFGTGTQMQPGTANWYAGGSQGGFQGVAIADPGKGSSAVTIPYYCRTKMTLSMRDTGIGLPIEASQPIVFGALGMSQSVQNFLLLRSFTDDFQFSYFLGCPPVFVSYT